MDERSALVRLGEGGRFVFHRLFVVRQYKDSMGRLLLRAGKTDVNPTRIDVMFISTEHVNLPTTLEGLEIVDVTGTRDGDAITQETGITITDVRTFRVLSGVRRGHVIAGAVGYIEDTAEYWEPSGFTMDP